MPFIDFCVKIKTMAKDRERKHAESLYVDKGCTAREVAAKVGVTEATVSGWVSKYGWKARREATTISAVSRFENIRQVVSDLAEERRELKRDLDNALRIGDEAAAAEIRKTIARLDDGVAKWNKALESARDEAQISLSTYLEVMERIFNALRENNEKVYLQTLEFQEQHIVGISNKL